MEIKQTIPKGGQGQRDPQLAALQRLGLSVDELTALRRQGYLQRDERLAGGRGYWRLRFRYAGRLRTVYLGLDDAFVAQVQRELKDWQAAHDSRRQLARAVANGKQALRRAKLQRAPILADMGFHDHGDAVRQFRGGPR